MRRPQPLPDELPEAFSTNEARELGVGWRRLHASDLVAPFRGVRTIAPAAETATELDDPGFEKSEIIRLAHAYAKRMHDGEFFSHTTAAILWGIPLPLLNDTTLHVSVLRDHQPPRSRGVDGHQIDPRLVTLTEHDGLCIASPASTWATLGRMLGPYDLVAAGDAFVRVNRRAGGFGGAELLPPLAILDQLAATIAAGRRPGIPALRAALPRIRTDSWSRMESWTRLILEDAGLPEPELNYDAYDDHGRFIGCLDLAYPEFMVAVEYEGDHHRGRDQFAKDIDRIERLVQNGWRVIRVTSSLAFGARQELIRRVRLALRANGWAA